MNQETDLQINENLLKLLMKILNECVFTLKVGDYGKEGYKSCVFREGLIVNDPDLISKKMHVYFNALDETGIEPHERAEHRGLSQAIQGLGNQLHSKETLLKKTDFARVCSIWICMNAESSSSINGVVSHYSLEKIRMLENQKHDDNNEGSIMIFVIRLFKFFPNERCQNAREEWFMMWRILYDILIQDDFLHKKT